MAEASARLHEPPEQSMTDFEQALLDPNSVFKTPEEILNRDDLSRGETDPLLQSKAEGSDGDETRRCPI